MKSQTFFSTLVLLACLLAPGTAYAGGPTIDDVQPPAAVLGTVVTITGEGFGLGKPKVFLTQEGSSKKTALKVLASSDTEITAELKNAKGAGEYTLNVEPKGGVAATVPFALLPPFVFDVDADDLAPKDEASLIVANLGNKKPKVKVGGKKAKVVSVEPAISEGGALTIDIVTIVIPASLGNGAHDIELLNKLGIHVVDNAALVTMSDKKLGKPFFEALIDGKAFKTGGKLFQGQEAGGNVQVVATGGKNPTLGFSFLVPPFDAGDVPVAFDGFPDDLATFVYSETTLQGGIPDIDTWAHTDGDFQLVVTGIGGGQIAAEFTAELANGSGSREVSGSFIANIPAAN